MKIRLFKTGPKEPGKVMGAFYMSDRANPTIEDSIRKWREAYYLIIKGYYIFNMKHLCGLCKLHQFCNKCPMYTSPLCDSVQRVYCPESKVDISSIYSKWVHLRTRAKELKG